MGVSAAPVSSEARGASQRIVETARSAVGARPGSRTSSVVITVIVTALVGLALLVPVGAAMQVVLTSQLDDRSPTEAIVVLDPAQYWGNSRPVMKARLQHAAALYKEGVAPVVIVTGPQRRADDDRRVLLDSGVPDRDVVTFASGADTVGSLRVIAGVMRDLGWSSATVVTDPSHAARASATASALGIDAHMSPVNRGPAAVLTAEYVGREVAALLRHHLLTRWSLQPVVEPPA